MLRKRFPVRLLPNDTTAGNHVANRRVTRYLAAGVMQRSGIAFILFLAVASPARAQDREVPYWATIRASASELNMRVGPSADYPVKWVYKRPGLPVKVTRVHESWRLIQDPSGTKGWVAARLLSPDRGAIVTGGRPVPMRAGPTAEAALRWFIEAGVVGALGNCTSGWCEFTVGAYTGWVQQRRLWGAGRP